MKIKFCGAAEEVTGSKHLLTINGTKILLDCGLRQKNIEENIIYNREFLFDPKEVDVLLLSHAHLDHCGNIPNLYNQGFTGTTYTTHASKDLAKFIVLDAAKIQKHDVNFLFKKFGTNIKPLYNEEDIDRAWANFVSVKYKETIQITPEIKVTFIDAGHILGSAQIYIEFFDQYDKKQKSLLFTGDLGRKDLPILKDPDYIESADIVITETTYGNSTHDNIENIYKDLPWIINDVYQRGGKVLIPAFAMERTQELIYALHLLISEKKIPEIPIYVDSPLASHMTDVFEKHKNLFDDESYKDFFKNHQAPLQAPYIHYVESVNESKKINAIKDQVIIVSGAGMLSGGRMLHHLIHNLDNPKNLVLVIGYMVHNTLGRALIEGHESITILKNKVRIRAQVEILDSFSGHADKIDLLNYIPNIKNLKNIFLVHGDEREYIPFKENLKLFTKDVNIEIPSLGEEFII